jgi:glycosyltransferase involved in cell wall biosynthesis
LKTCSIVIPAYKSQATLNELIERLAKVLPQSFDQYEVIIVNDGSPDLTWSIIEELASKNKWVRGINLMRNYGQHNATLCGIMQAKYEIIITMDDDLQHPPEEIPHLIEKLNEGFDVVYGIPSNKVHSWWRTWFSNGLKKLLSFVMGVKSMRGIGSFRAFRSNIRKAFKSFNKPEVIVDILLSWGTNKFGYAYVEEKPRTNGESNYSFSKLFRLAFTVLTGFSTAPLRFTSIVGFSFMIFGIFAFIYVLVVYFTAGSVLGFSFLASLISIFSGALLFALGIFGEYLARIFERTSERPCFTIGQTTDGEEE